MLKTPPPIIKLDFGDARISSLNTRRFKTHSVRRVTIKLIPSLYFYSRLLGFLNRNKNQEQRTKKKHPKSHRKNFSCTLVSSLESAWRQSQPSAPPQAWYYKGTTMLHNKQSLTKTKEQRSEEESPGS